MAKPNSAAWIKLGLPLLVILAGIVSTFVWVQADTKAVGVEVESVKKDVEKLEEDGCDPAKTNTMEVALTKKDIVTLQKTVDEMRIEHKDGVKTILEAIENN